MPPDDGDSPARVRRREVVRALTRLLEDRLVNRLLSVVGLLVVVGQIVVWYPRYALEPAGSGFDFPIYQRAAARAAQGLSAYEPCAHDSAVAPSCLLYPPPFAAAVALAGRASPSGFQKGTYLVLLVAFWAYAAGLVKLARGRVAVSSTLIAGALLFVTPGVNVTMGLGNLDVVVWALMAWGLAVEAALPLLVVAAAFKLWPVVSLAALLVAKPARLRAAVVTAALVLAATLAVLGPSSFADWRHLAVPGLQAGTLKPTNVSVVAILGRLGLTIRGPVLTLLPLAAAGLAGWLLRRQSERLRAAVVGIAATACSPIFWSKYAAVLLLPVAAWFSQRRLRGSASPPRATPG